MDKTRILSGDQVVNNGAIKNHLSLPEIGSKDVTPTFSTLEVKQTATALENRKQLIEVERIEKSGTLSQADWREDLKLAQVTKKVGSYWSYLGHDEGDQLFLYPEEALFLIEINCLLLKYNGVKVSMQQAYALLLGSTISLTQYKVYASLSRVGYRVYRHKMKESEPMDCENSINSPQRPNANQGKIVPQNSDNVRGKRCAKNSLETNEHVKRKRMCPNSSQTSSNVNVTADNPTCEDIPQITQAQNITLISDGASTSNSLNANIEMNLNKSKVLKYIQHKIYQLKNRKYKASTKLRDSFDKIPNCYTNPVVSIVAPERQFLPGNIQLKSSSYILNVQKLRTNIKQEPTSNTPNGITVCGSNITPKENAQGDDNDNSDNECFNYRPSRRRRYTPSEYFFPPECYDFDEFNLTLRKPLEPNQDISIMTPLDIEREETRKGLYNNIQKVAELVRNGIRMNRPPDQNMIRLIQLVEVHNLLYNKRLIITRDFSVIDNENVVDTIVLNDEDEHTEKKKKNNPDAFNVKLRKLKQLANKLSSLDTKKATPGLRRMFTRLMDKFNSLYNVNYYLNDNFDVIDRNDLTHPSDDEAKPPPTMTKSRKLRNPLSILKDILENQKQLPWPNEDTTSKCPLEYDTLTEQTFKNGWLPATSDFGRAEIISKNLARHVIDVRKDELLLDFMKIQPDRFNSWLDVKVSFLECLHRASDLFNYSNENNIPGTQIESLVKPGDFTDTASFLKKLSIINRAERTKMTSDGANLTVHFDVYNRDVKMFKKSHRPSPHFRIICIEESSTMPSGADIESLHSKYNDNVTILFAVVGTASITYLQVNPGDLEVYNPCEDNTV